MQLRLSRQHSRAREHGRAGGGAVGREASSRSTTSLPEAKQGQGSSGRALAEVVDGAERQAIEAALRECDGSRERAANLLGISATTLWRKMTRLGITFDTR